ncbi:MAG: hypothetical protein JXB26_09250 [Candidatus Aminicenantes bacterium]|nr:hypothetical protein [Candidatus Aminicenantes bacterium]
MAEKREQNTRMDDFIKKVLCDDLPQETERRMKNRLDLFKEKIGSAGRTSKTIQKNLWSIGSQEWLRRAFRKELLVFSSLIMIFAGGFFHISGRKNAVAETLSMLNTSFSVLDRIREAHSMECRLHVSAGDETCLDYTIRWLTPGKTRVDVTKGETAIKTLWTEGGGFVVADHIHKDIRRYSSLERIEDSLFGPAWDFFSPEQLADAVYKRWKPLNCQDKDHRKTFIFVNGNVVLELTVDGNSYQPLRMKILASGPTEDVDVRYRILEAQFFWNIQVSPKIFKTP